MTAPQPATIATEIDDKLNQIILTASKLGDFTPFSKTELMREIVKLQKYDRFEADMLSAKLAHLDGDISAMRSALKNANANRPSAVFDVRKQKTVFCGNLLLATDALKEALSVCNQKGEHIDANFPHAVATIGGFQGVATLATRILEMNFHLEDYPNVSTLRQAAEILRRHDVTDEQCASVIDVAGDVMRGRHLLWRNRSPDFYVSPVGDFVKIDYRVAVSAKEAALMSFEMTDMLIEKNLAGLPFYVDFLGEAA
ncbi:MAG: hypothetical protein QM533_04995 [Cytophagales bacterium]|nr:hypothetical protein [Cytophagales bacterium]